MPSKNPNNHEYRFTGTIGLKNKTQPLSVRFPPDIMEILKSRTDTQDFVRAAVAEKLERESNLLTSEVGKEAIAPPAKKTRARKTSKQVDMPA